MVNISTFTPNYCGWENMKDLEGEKLTDFIFSVSHKFPLARFDSFYVKMQYEYVLLKVSQFLWKIFVGDAMENSC